MTSFRAKFNDLRHVLDRQRIAAIERKDIDAAQAACNAQKYVESVASGPRLGLTMTGSARFYN